MSALIFLSCLLAMDPADSALPTEKPFGIQVVDQETGRGVPLVELRTVNDIRYFTDSAGWVACREPGLMDQRVFFHVSSHGYEHAADRFGYRGVRLQVVPGGKAVIRIRRRNVAERLYRVTGAGVYRDSHLLQRATPTRQPLLNGQVFGSDSVVNAVFRGKIYWFWGDTNRPAYPLGNFHVPGATSQLPADGGLSPDQGIDLEYFVNDDGFAKPTAQMPGKGPTWIGGLTVVADTENDQQERMFASYVKVQPPLTIYERGLVEFDPRTNQFQRKQVFPKDAPLYLHGHAVQHDGHVYFANPYPYVRTRATAAAVQELASYEAYTCVDQNTAETPTVSRNAAGELQFAWRRGAAVYSRKVEERLLKDGLIEPHERRFPLRDVQSGKRVLAHSGSVAWNAWRKRWVMIALESFGTSPLGELWYVESPSLEGPWLDARKIVTHEKYSFYNPKSHPMLDQDGGRSIYLEGTYTAMFSGNNNRTPRYNYNQIMYRLDLNDPRLALPVRFQVVNGRYVQRSKGPAAAGDFYALPRPGVETVPLVSEMAAQGRERLRLARDQEPSDARVLCHVYAPDDRSMDATRMLVEMPAGAAARYAIGDSKNARPVARVWPGR